MRKTIDIGNYRFDNSLIEEIINFRHSPQIIKLVNSKKTNVPHFTYVRIWGDYGVEFRINSKPYSFFKVGNHNGFEKSTILAEYLNKILN
jgi:hypothetical protein